MANPEFIRERVKEYYTENPIGSSAADAFAPWWMTKRFSLSPADANRQCADSPTDGVLAGFHLDLEQKNPVLYLVVAPFDDARSTIKSGISSFGRTLMDLREILKGREAEAPAKAGLLTRLGAIIEKNRDHLKNLRIELVVLHLSKEPREVLHQAFASAYESVARLSRRLLPSYRVEIKALGPADLAPNYAVAHIPAAEHQLEFHGVALPSDKGVSYFVGFGKLADLVRLYGEYSDQLFSKNVRAFLYKSLQQGPAYHMRQTLGGICDKSTPKGQRVDPSTFAIYHNGVTLHAVSAEIAKDKISIREPNVLNGCQTVKNAYLYKHKLDKQLDPQAWEDILIPLRVLVTAEEELIRNVTVSNNRQNSIRPSAFRANDPLQLSLSEKFRDRAIFYERQEGAFENLKRSSPGQLENDYRNSAEAPLTMEELAQVIATASNLPALSVVTSVSNLFDDTQYKRVFAPAHLKELELLVFLRNLFRVTSLSLKDLREEVQKLSELKPEKFKFPVFRILSRYLVKHSPELVQRYGQKVESRVGAQHPLRVEVVKMMRSSHSGLQQLLYDVWFDSSLQQWKNATDKECAEQVLRKLRLADVSVFDYRKP